MTAVLMHIIARFIFSVCRRIFTFAVARSPFLQFFLARLFLIHRTTHITIPRTSPTHSWFTRSIHVRATIVQHPNQPHDDVQNTWTFYTDTLTTHR